MSAIHEHLAGHLARLRSLAEELIEEAALLAREASEAASTPALPPPSPDETLPPVAEVTIPSPPPEVIDSHRAELTIAAGHAEDALDLAVDNHRKTFDFLVATASACARSLDLLSEKRFTP